MKTLGNALTLTAALLCASNPVTAQAGRGCGHGHAGRSARVIRPVSPPTIVAYQPPAYVMAATPIPTPATPQAATVNPTTRVMAAPNAGPIASGGTPAYVYQATPGGSPAYYYTYDKDDRLVPVQWMDWIFRGGREAGEPRPPLPIIGRLQGR
jgi:hypothetical protein